MGTVALRVTNATKSYGGHRGTNTVLNRLDLAIDGGEFVVLLGRSGCGKSTLLRVLAGVEQLDGGGVEWPDSPDEQPRTGTVFQQSLLMPWLTVRDNVLFGGRYRANRARFDRTWAEGLLARFGLAELADSYPDQLSGGQAQRVAIARAAAIRPRLLLLDEPFSALDVATRVDLHGWLRATIENLGLTTVLVTHDIDEAIALADRIALLDGTGGIRRTWDNRTGALPTPVLRDELLDHFDSGAPAAATSSR